MTPITTHTEVGLHIVESAGSLEERLLIGGRGVSLRLAPTVRGEQTTRVDTNSREKHGPTRFTTNQQ